MWKVGGESGEGIESTGDIFASSLHTIGYYVFGFRHFPSRIRGGHTNYQARVSTRPVRCPGSRVDLLVAFDQGSIDWNLPEMAPGGVILYDETTFRGTTPAGAGVKLYGVPLTELARECGSPIMKNMVAAGATAAFLGIAPELFETPIRRRFAHKGERVLAANRLAVRRGFEYCKEHFDTGAGEPLAPPPQHRQERFFLSGNEALALGALLGGCRVAAAYPITPATDIMEWLREHLPALGGTVIQAEDELAAVNLVIGANYAGVRALTATSGPGLSLMIEAIGLAGAAEVPCVVVDVQRAGPSTGMPTRHEQADLNMAVFGGHGDFPRVVIAPATVEDAFWMGAEAFNLAERYQCPVIVLSDFQLGMSRTSVDSLDPAVIRIDRGLLITNGELATARSAFRRYALTPSGISPRTIPGVKGGHFFLSGTEHEESGKVSDHPGNRVAMHAKRLRKLEHVDFTRWVERYGASDPELLVVSSGSTFAAIREALRRLQAEGKRVAHVHLKGLWPLPAATLRPLFAGARRVAVVEQSAGGQLAGLLRREVGFADKTVHRRKFDGIPFLPGEIYEFCKEVA